MASYSGSHSNFNRGGTRIEEGEFSEDLRKKELEEDENLTSQECFQKIYKK
jgi:hypothetical protein